MLRLNIKKEKIFEVLNPKFSWMQKIKKKNKTNSKKKKIIFLSELSTGLNDNNFLKIKIIIFQVLQIVIKEPKLFLKN